MIPTLSEKDARDLGRTIAKQASNVRVKFGTVNGHRVLHVFVPGANDMSRNVFTIGDWEMHPANERVKRNDQFAKEQGTEALMASNGSKK